ncbi:uncharacterized protein TNIN_436841 [Trichonephila inaurata madagascariensis]|uniref:Mutator-like transposase domain-containing protein n=1 Tax=Trichonephila inaurata madagascariensis TaxID=2747483 RepID=A0A8X6YW35_9ARAC|nr:uncharacterized protein TNIN_436841 [Trichonephila inaurata madagascariensis]
MHNINLSFVFGLRTIGKGHSAARKLCSTINVNFPSKTAFRCLEKKLEHVSNKVACKIMNEAAAEVHKKNNFVEVIQCGVAVDGTWQRRGHLSCVSVISIDTDVLNQAQVQVGANTERNFAQLDEERVSESKRHSLSEVKTSRKKK